MSVVMEFRGGPLAGTVTMKDWPQAPVSITDRRGGGQYQRAEAISIDSTGQAGWAYVWVDASGEELEEDTDG